MTTHEPHGTDDAEVVRALLREHAPAPPDAHVDWSALHARITHAAAPLLAARTHRPVWWQLLADRATPAIPLTAAAAAALVLVLGFGVLDRVPTSAAPVASPAFVTLEEELAGSSAALRAAGSDAGAVLDALLFYDLEGE